MKKRMKLTVTFCVKPFRNENDLKTSPSKMKLQIRILPYILFLSSQEWHKRKWNQGAPQLAWEFTRLESNRKFLGFNEEGTVKGKAHNS